MPFLQDLELEDGKEYNFISLPVDEFGNMPYFGSSPMIMRARVELRHGDPGTVGSVARLHIIAPAEMAERWPSVLERSYSGGFFVRTRRSLKPGPVTRKLYIQLVTEFVDAKAPEKEWMIKALER